MPNNFSSRGYDLDYYNLFLRNYLSEHRFPDHLEKLIISETDYSAKKE